ncbi:MAG: Eco57I restriction-modification methylase domain-containing protein, partial [Clostridia bacterium]
DLLGESNDTSMERPMCRIMDWRGLGSMQYSTRMTRKGTVMKFDFVIGNPPYQEEATGGSTSDKPVYNLFMDAAYQVADKVELISPARFLYNAGATPSAWNKKMLADPHLKVIKYEGNSQKIFPSVLIPGGIAITYRDVNSTYTAIDTFTPFTELNSILDKVRIHAGFIGMNGIVISRTSYRLTDKMHADHPAAISQLSNGHAHDMSTNIFQLLPQIFFDSKPEDGNDYIQIIGRDNSTRSCKYIRRDYVNNVCNLDKFKVYMSKADGAAGTLGHPIPARIVGKTEIAKPVVGFTESFIGIGLFETIDEAQAAQKYITSRFARALLGILKTTQDITPEKWKWVPLQDFSKNSDIDWSAAIPDIDKQLYRKYGLSSDEIAFIETHVKEMA